jgi:hypothetical protein
MKLKLKEDPKEWRKAMWMGALSLGIFSSLLRWRGVVSTKVWIFLLCCLAFLAVAAALQPQWFRGYYRFTAKMGFGISQLAGRAVLALFFFIIVIPLGLVLRMLGKDPLRLRRPTGVESYWSRVREQSSLERLF